MFWLLTVLAWGTIRLLTTWTSADLLEGNVWGFGQVMALLLIALPFLSISERLFTSTSSSQVKSSDADVLILRQQNLKIYLWTQIVSAVQTHYRLKDKQVTLNLSKMSEHLLISWPTTEKTRLVPKLGSFDVWNGDHCYHRHAI